VIEEGLRRELGFDLLERLCEKDKLGEAEAQTLALKAQHMTGRRC
jgi:hypothetical protein